MATTTNYSWSTPDDTSLVKDGAAAIRSLGSAIDSTVFTNAGAAINKTIIDAKGDLIVGSAADTAAILGVGTDGYVLTADSGATNGLAWALAAGGKVKQVVSATTTTTTVINTTSLTDTGITATITPTASNSTILVIVSAAVVHFRTAGASSIGGKVLRASTTIGDFGGDGWSGNFATVTGITLCGSFTVQTWNYLDSPATTSATTYKMQGRLEITANSSTSEWQPGNKPSTITLIEIGA